MLLRAGWAANSRLLAPRPCTGNSWKAPARSMSAEAAQSTLLCDAHCHPQDDAEHSHHVGGLAARQIAVMGCREGDWPAVASMHQLHPEKVLPAFGVHPWFAHLHALHPGQDLADIVECTETAAELHRLGEVSHGWEATLVQLLQQHPNSIVGEFGLDRAAVIQGTRLQTKLSHQLELTSRQLRLAAQLGRPVSLHCVRAYGHLAQLFRDLGPDQLPPKLMLHSYGGSVDMVKSFTKLPKGLGSRIYFSFSSVINGHNADKLRQRIACVPDNRLLIESDQNTPLHIDQALHEILQVVCAAKGWEPEQAARQTTANFMDFYLQ